jgi:hypothetical protein
VYLADGTFSASQAFIESVGLFEDARSWHHLVIFTLGQLPPSAYVSALCTLPGNGQGVLYGVTAIQP